MDITVEDIARMANVSRGTVDRVIHNRGRVSPETEMKVRKIIEEQDYRPNPLGRAFSLSQKKMKLGVMLLFKETQFGEQVLRGVREAQTLAEQHGFEVLVEILESYSTENCLRILNRFAAESVSGIAMRGFAYEEVETTTRKLREKGIKIAVLNSDMDGTSRDCFIGQNHQKSGRCAAFLMGEICCLPGKILILGVDSHHRASLERIDSFCKLFEETHPEGVTMDVRFCEGKNETSYEIVRTYIDDAPDLRGIFVSGAGLCGVGQAIAEKGMAGSVKVVGFDVTPTNTKYLENGAVQFLIDQNPYQQGFLPIKLLTESLFYDRAFEEEYYDTGVTIKSRYNL